jgi:hypothetical protein
VSPVVGIKSVFVMMEGSGYKMGEGIESNGGVGKVSGKYRGNVLLAGV